MPDSGLVYVPDDNNPEMGTIVGVNQNVEALGDQLRELLARDGFRKTASILRAHDWRFLDLDYPYDDEVGSVGSVAGYGEFFNDPDEAVNITSDVPSDALGSFRALSPRLYVIHPDGTVSRT